MSNKNGTSGKNLISFLSFWGLAAIALVLILSLFGFHADLIMKIALIISGVILALNALMYVKGAKTWKLIVYIVSVVLIILEIGIPMVKSILK